MPGLPDPTRRLPSTARRWPFARATGHPTALWGAPNLMSYVASKGAVIAMTRSLARELGPDRVGVTAVAPGILTTPSTDYVPEARHQHYADGRAVPCAARFYRGRVRGQREKARGCRYAVALNDNGAVVQRAPRMKDGAQQMA